MSFITEFYLGNIIPTDKDFKPNSEYSKALDAVVESEQRLEDELSKEQKQLQKAVVEAHEEFLYVSVKESFTDGFRIGAAFTLDTFAVNDNGTVDFQKK